MGRAGKRAALFLLCLMATTCEGAEPTCPEAQVVELNGSKLTILRGCAGMPGSSGAQGPPGFPGAKGERGLQGIPGEVGPSGPKGEKGEAGKRGEKGNKGDIGVIDEKAFDTLQCKQGPRSCKELLAQGVVLSDWYTIYPKDCRPLRVLCDMHTDGGGWLVFQRRSDGSVDFFRDWADYKKGFGSQLNEFWLGNDHLHLLTSLGKNEMRVDLIDFENKLTFAKYGSFQVANESNLYRLSVGDFKGGPAGDSLTIHDTMAFSTRDKINNPPGRKCPLICKGAWWYKQCHDSNLNAQYLRGHHNSNADGINWKTGRGHHYAYKHTEMKIRPTT